MNQEQYYYSSDNGESWVGTFDLQQLNELRASGVVQPSFLIYSSGEKAEQGHQPTPNPPALPPNYPQPAGYPQPQGYPPPPQNYQPPQVAPQIQGYVQPPPYPQAQQVYQQPQVAPQVQVVVQQSVPPRYVPAQRQEPSLLGGLFIVKFEGRMRRQNYWLSQLLFAPVITIAIVVIISLFTDGYYETEEEAEVAMSLTAFFLVIMALYFMLVGLGMQIRRLHDIGKSGWMVLLNLIVGIGSLILFVMYCTDSQRGTNQWGPNPKGY